MARLLVVAVLVAALLLPAADARAQGAATAPTRTVEVDGLTIAYRTVGKGRPVVLIQGLSGTMDGWDPTFVDALARAGHRVVLFDNEGVGRSEARRAPLTIRRMGDNTARLIRALRLKRPDVVGWSMGGMIAQSFAVRHPRSLRRLVLLATAPGDGRAAMPTAAGSAILTGEGDAATATSALFPPGHEADAERFVRNLARRRGFVPRAPQAVIQRQIAASGTWLLGGDADGRKVARLKLPVLVGGGELDPLLPVANQVRLGRIIPRAQLVTYRDAAHAFFLQERKHFLPRLTRFLRR
jgi:pimeloyl-ACP methyl ester carboxylesterase